MAASPPQRQRRTPSTRGYSGHTQSLILEMEIAEVPTGLAGLIRYLLPYPLAPRPDKAGVILSLSLLHEVIQDFSRHPGQSQTRIGGDILCILQQINLYPSLESHEPESGEIPGESWP